MIDFHTHSIFSDGELIPSELVRRAMVKGYQAIAITDHADHSNIDFIIPRIVKICKKLSSAFDIFAIPGIELTHVPTVYIPELVMEARMMGAKIVVAHGETIVEPVPEGTNLAALKASVDILAHPGLITDEEARLAAKNNVFLEITTRRGHCLTNGHVVKTARSLGAKLLINTDSHSPDDLTPRGKAEAIARGAGLTDEEVSLIFKNARSLAEAVSS